MARATPHLDGKHVVFGKCVKVPRIPRTNTSTSTHPPHTDTTQGLDLVKQVEQSDTDDSDKPHPAVVVLDCGEVVEKKAEDKKKGESPLLLLRSVRALCWCGRQAPCGA